jgi:hypothetical protein
LNLLEYISIIFASVAWDATVPKSQLELPDILAIAIDQHPTTLRHTTISTAFAQNGAMTSSLSSAGQD